MACPSGGVRAVLAEDARGLAGSVRGGRVDAVTETSAAPTTTASSASSDSAGTAAEIQFRSDVTVELVRSSAHDSDVLFAARVSTMGEQTLEVAQNDDRRAEVQAKRDPGSSTT